jgi:hypothetical protein
LRIKRKRTEQFPITTLKQAFVASNRQFFAQFDMILRAFACLCGARKERGQGSVISGSGFGGQKGGDRGNKGAWYPTLAARTKTPPGWGIRWLCEGEKKKNAGPSTRCARYDSGTVGFVFSHPSGKDRDATRMGHPFIARERERGSPARKLSALASNYLLQSSYSLSKKGIRSHRACAPQGGGRHVFVIKQ